MAPPSAHCSCEVVVTAAVGETSVTIAFPSHLLDALHTGRHNILCSPNGAKSSFKKKTQGKTLNMLSLCCHGEGTEGWGLGSRRTSAFYLLNQPPRKLGGSYFFYSPHEPVLATAPIGSPLAKKQLMGSTT
jgi:hypothetical protein